MVNDQGQVAEPGIRTRLLKVQDSPEPIHGISRPLFILLASYNTFALCCTDQYQANMLEMAVEFGCSNQAMSFTIQVNLLISGISALLMGSLSDFHGRVPIFRVCCALLVCSTACCAFAPSYGFFLAGRVMQGIGEGGLALVNAILKRPLR
jgi:DHA1 family bicyclomycin/chloramphenicol resistance-like MFS transporter